MPCENVTLYNIIVFCFDSLSNEFPVRRLEFPDGSLISYLRFSC